MRRLESLMLIHFQKGSLALTREWRAGRMHIDLRSVVELELLRNKRDGKTDGTLLAVLDRTCTREGRRALVADILSPPCDPVSPATRRRPPCRPSAVEVSREDASRTLEAHP